jgi:trehalose 6-phosphate synthase
MARRLIVVSNRVTVPDGKASAGGLAVGIQNALKEHDGIWFGWSGKVVARASGRAKVVQEDNAIFATVDLTNDEYDHYYNGYANQTLWPLFHYRIDLAVFDRAFYPGYQRVNAKFARILAPMLKPSDLVWVHDYHLIPLGEELRSAGCKMPLGFFLHIPFPAAQVYRTLYNHKRLARHLLNYDVVGFQTEADVEAFYDVVEQVGGEVQDDGTVVAYGRTVYCDSFPIGIDADEMVGLAESGLAKAQIRRQLNTIGTTKLAIGVDRLDYSKGLPNRMAAFECLLANYPGMRGRVTLLQIAAPTRVDVPEYVAIRRELERAAGHINGRFAEFDWEPVRYINRSYSRSSLAGLYRASAVGLVTPLRDGMNLVAKEFVAAQDPEDPGVLVLSCFAGAAEQMTEAIKVNPYDVMAMADVLGKALTMPLAERRRRWTALMEGVRLENISWWTRRFLEALESTASRK